MKNIIISNPKKLKEIKKRIRQGGKDNLHVIADFDRTLTKSFIDGKRNPAIIAHIRHEGYLTPDYPKKAFALFNKYHPIEISTKISLKEKKKKMDEWWRKHFKLLIKSGMNLETINDVIKNKKIALREGALEFFDNLNQNNIFLIIMSAGPGDMIKEYLKSEKKLYKNTHVIGNLFKFDKKGNAISFNEPIIHAFNKTETSVKNLPIYNELLKRKNVILLGDLVADIGMVEGFPYDNLIKIGFLNENVEERLKVFKENYDVVILNNSDMNYVNELIGEVVGD